MQRITTYLKRPYVLRRRLERARVKKLKKFPPNSRRIVVDNYLTAQWGPNLTTL